MWIGKILVGDAGSSCICLTYLEYLCIGAGSDLAGCGYWIISRPHASLLRAPLFAVANDKGSEKS